MRVLFSFVEQRERDSTGVVAITKVQKASTFTGKVESVFRVYAATNGKTKGRRNNQK